MEKNISILSRIRVGDVVTADLLNDISSAINRNTRAVAAPRQIGSGSNYSEFSRDTSTVQIFDQNQENYAEIQRIDSVSFQNENGATITLNFNN